MPVYNGSRYVAQAIESILSQTVQPQEVIVSDSGSSDNTIDIVASLLERSGLPWSLVCDKSGGMVSNWNTAVRSAKCEYVKFLFQDDLLAPSCLESMVGYAAEHPEVGFVFSLRDLLVEPAASASPLTRWLEEHRNLGELLPPLSRPTKGNSVLHSPHLLRDPVNKIGEPTVVLVRRQLFETAGLFNEQMTQLVDIEMWIRLLTVTYVGCIPRVLAFFRVHEEQASASNWDSDDHTADTREFFRTLASPAVYKHLHARVRRTVRANAEVPNLALPLSIAIIDRFYEFVRRVHNATRVST